MTKEQTKNLRAALIALLDDENGITEKGYCALQELVYGLSPGACDDIFLSTNGCDGRVFLSEDHGIVAWQSNFFGYTDGVERISGQGTVKSGSPAKRLWTR